MASFNEQDSKKAKLLWELEYYTNLVSEHEKLQQTGKTAKDNKPNVYVKPFQLSLQTSNCSGSQILPAGNTFKLSSNKQLNYKRTVVHSKFTNPKPNTIYSYPKRFVVTPTLTEKETSAPFATSINKVNNIHQHTVLHNTKKVVPNATVNVPNRSVLLPECTLKRTNESVSKPQFCNPAISGGPGKISADMQKKVLNASSKKHIEELKELAKQLELRSKKRLLLAQKIKTSSKGSDVSVSTILPDTINLPSKKTNLHCLVKPECVLETNTGNVKNCPIITNSTSDDLSKISNVETVPLSVNDNLSSLKSTNIETPAANSMGQKGLGDKSIHSSSNTLEVQGEDTSVQFMKNPKLFLTNNASIKKDTLSLPKTVTPELPTNVNLKTPINSSLMKAKCLLESKLSVSSKQISNMSKVSLTKLVNSQKPLTNSVSTPVAKRMIAQKQSSTKKQGNVTKLIASKYKVVNKRHSPVVSSKNRLPEYKILLGTSKDTSMKLKFQRNANPSCASTPLAKTTKGQKVNSIRKQGSMTKLIASKYKVINKRLSTAVSSKNRLSEASMIKANNLLGTSKDTSTKLKFQKNEQPICDSTPLAKTVKGQKVSSIKKQGSMTKLIASKYKVVNKKILNSSASLSKSRFSKGQQEVAPNSFNKWYPHTTSKTPSSIKILNSNYRVVNNVKTPKRLNNSLLKSPSPIYLKKGKYVLKRRKSDTSISINAKKFKNGQSPMLLKPQFKHTKLNHLVVASYKKSTKPNLRIKSSSSCSPLKSKYKVINRRGSSKKSPQNSSPNPSPVLRTKSGVDIDLLLELAAEKESDENESRIGLSKRVYKSKNTIVNKNVCSASRAKMARMIKAKYLLNRSVSQKQAVSKKFFATKYYKGRYLQRTPARQFCNPKIKRNYFKFPVQNNKHKLIRNYRASSQYVKTNKRIFTYGNEHLRTLQNRATSTPISKVLASRVLHQSISRVITASAKKKLSKVNTYCMFYNRFGRCNKGLKCTYVHDPSKIAVCTRFLRGTCKNEKCLFSHEISPGKMAICSFFLLGSCTKTDCPYRHETLLPNAVLCKAFVQGYCPDGKLCKKAHVLVCPHFIQGICEKGDTCAFPHPPPKEKKMLPKPVEKRETRIEEEDLMERMSRYFQPSNEQSVALATNKTTVVPRRQKLPEQPSFIAL